MTDLITAPGHYDLPITDYHGQPCDAPSISSTGLRMIREKSPAHFWAHSPLNPHGEPKEATASLDFGKAAHSLLLEGKLPETEFAVAPFAGGYSTNEDGWKAGEKRKWRDQQQEAGLSIVSQTDLETITAMAERLGAHPLVRDGILKGEIEKSLFWKPDFDVEADFWLKARPDVVPHDDIVVDYKTVANASIDKIVRATADYGYHMQMAMMADGIRNVYGRDIKHMALLVQEKEPPYVVALRTLSPSYIIAGRMEYQRAAQTFARCLKTGDWPGYEDGDIHLPDWLDRKLTKTEEEAA